MYNIWIGNTINNSRDKDTNRIVVESYFKYSGVAIAQRRRYGRYTRYCRILNTWRWKINRDVDTDCTHDIES